MIAGVIASLGGGTLTVTRRAAGTYVNGVLVPGATTTLSIVGLVAPLSGEEMRREAPGRSSGDVQWVMTATAVLVPRGAPDTAQGGDLVSINGISYEVEAVERYAPSWTTGYRARVAKVG